MMRYCDAVKRVQIQLTEEQEARLKRRALASGRSVSAVIREAVDRLGGDGDRDDRVRQVMKLAGKYRSGVTDLGENHDRYLAEAYRK